VSPRPVLFSLVLPRPPSSTLFPYTTLFRSQLTAEQIRQFGVTFATVEERTLSGEVRTVGIVNFDETRVAIVAPKFSGYVERLHRSEEHTSELQSRENLVCRLLLEKKKKRET